MVGLNEQFNVCYPGTDRVHNSNRKSRCNGNKRCQFAPLPKCPAGLCSQRVSGILMSTTVTTSSSQHKSEKTRIWKSHTSLCRLAKSWWRRFALPQPQSDQLYNFEVSCWPPALSFILFCSGVELSRLRRMLRVVLVSLSRLALLARVQGLTSRAVRHAPVLSRLFSPLR